MLGILAFVVAVIGAVLSKVDKTISMQDLFCIAFIVLALLSLQTVWSWAPWTGRGPNG